MTTLTSLEFQVKALESELTRLQEADLMDDAYWGLEDEFFKLRKLFQIESCNLIVKNYQHLTSAIIYVAEQDDYDIPISCGFNLYENKINMNLPEVQDVAQKFIMDIQEVFLYILLHEIGHSLDPSLESLKSEYSPQAIYQSEIKAWEIADTLIGEQSANANYQLLKSWALSSYNPENNLGI